MLLLEGPAAVRVREDHVVVEQLVQAGDAALGPPVQRGVATPLVGCEVVERGKQERAEAPARAIDPREQAAGQREHEEVLRQVGGFVGVWLAGWLYDRTGSYDVAFMLSIGLGVFAALVNLPVNEKPLAERRAAAAAA